MYTAKMLSFLQLLQQQAATSFSTSMSMATLFSLILPLMLLLIFLIKWFFMVTSTTKNLPPSPTKLPILGNIHQLGRNTHQSLYSLAQRYGPVMLLRFGTVPTLIISSPDAAREVMKTQDLAFAERPGSDRARSIFYGMKDLTTSPYGEHWRQTRKIGVLHMLSKKRVMSIHSLRAEATELLMSRIRDDQSTNSTVDLSDLIVSFSHSVACRAVFGRRKGAGVDQDGLKIKNLFKAFIEVMGLFCFRDVAPWWLRWLDRVVGTDATIASVSKSVDEFLEDLIGEREARQSSTTGSIVDSDAGEQMTEDLVDSLLMSQKDGSFGSSLDRDTMKALLIDLYIGGTDTSTSVLEWTMSELLRNPKTMKKLQCEVREILKGKQEPSEDDLDKMAFMKAVIKETMRCHPPVPLHFRHVREDVQIMGYEVAAGTFVLINSWCLARDPKYWEDPHAFRPERFLDDDHDQGSKYNSNIDFKGIDNFQYLPFGAGKRQCPGIKFAMVNLEYVLANLVSKFDWGLPKGVEAEDLDMAECPGHVLRRLTPLLAIATPYPSC